MELKPEPEPVIQPQQTETPQAAAEENNPDIFKEAREKLKESLAKNEEINKQPKEEKAKKRAEKEEARRNTAATAPENTTTVRRVLQLINLKADTPTQEQIWKDFNTFGHVEYVRKITDKSKKTTAYISFTKEDNANFAIDSFYPQKYGEQVKLIYAKIQPAAYDSNKKIINKKGGYYYGKDEYNTPTTLEYLNVNDIRLNEGDSVVSWETITPQETVTNTVSISYLQSLKSEDLINWIKTNAPTNQDKINIIGQLLYQEIIKIRPDTVEAANIVNNLFFTIGVNEEQAYNILENLKDDIPLIINDYDSRKNAQVFNNQLNNQNWAQAMEEQAVVSKSPFNRGSISEKMKNIAKKQ